MHIDLRPDDIETFRTQGFAVVEGVLRADEIAACRRAVEEAVAAQTVVIPGRNASQLTAGELQGEDEGTARFMRRWQATFVQRINLWKTSAPLRELVLGGELGRTAATFAGVERVRIWQDQALLKPPYGEPTAFHVDASLWPFRDERALSIWIALDDVTVESGCLYYLPGSHRTDVGRSVRVDARVGELFDDHPSLREVDAVACPVPAGSVCIHSSTVVHGAGPNMTSRPRRAYACSFMPDGTAFGGRQSVLSDEYFGRLAVGDLLTDDEQNPLACPA